MDAIPDTVRWRPQRRPEQPRKLSSTPLVLIKAALRAAAASRVLAALRAAPRRRSATSADRSIVGPPGLIDPGLEWSVDAEEGTLAPAVDPTTSTHPAFGNATTSERHNRHTPRSPRHLRTVKRATTQYLARSRRLGRGQSAYTAEHVSATPQHARRNSRLPDRRRRGG